MDKATITDASGRPVDLEALNPSPNELDEGADTDPDASSEPVEVAGTGGRGEYAGRDRHGLRDGRRGSSGSGHRRALSEQRPGTRGFARTRGLVS